MGGIGAWQPASGLYGTTQFYPGLRLLEVLKGVGSAAIVASVCPKIADPDRSAEPGFGYSPVIDAIVRRVGSGLAK